MRAIIITFSIIGGVALFLLGGLLNAVSSGLGLDVLAPYNDPGRVVATFIGDLPGFVLALAGLGSALYDAARRGASGWFIGLLVWPMIPLVAASLMYAGALAYAIDWFVPLAFIPLGPLLYGLMALPAPAAIPAPPAVVGALPGARPPVRFFVFVGLLVLVTLAGGALLFVPNLQPGATTPSGPPALQVVEPSATANCANGMYPPVTLTNTGAQMLQWTAKSQDPNVTANPSEGSLAPGASAQVAFTGKTTAADVIVQFVTAGGRGVAKFGCQPGAGK
jgi:hypothetical protein